MRKERTLLVLGLWVIILPFLGFPNNWRKVLFIITGFLFVYLAYLFYMETKARLSKNDNGSKAFVDNVGIGE